MLILIVAVILLVLLLVTRNLKFGGAEPVTHIFTPKQFDKCVTVEPTKSTSNNYVDLTGNVINWKEYITGEFISSFGKKGSSTVDRFGCDLVDGDKMNGIKVAGRSFYLVTYIRPAEISFIQTCNLKPGKILSYMGGLKFIPTWLDSVTHGESEIFYDTSECKSFNQIVFRNNLTGNRRKTTHDNIVKCMDFVFENLEVGGDAFILISHSTVASEPIYALIQNYAQCFVSTSAQNTIFYTHPILKFEGLLTKPLPIKDGWYSVGDKKVYHKSNEEGLNDLGGSDKCFDFEPNYYDYCAELESNVKTMQNNPELIVDLASKAVNKAIEWCKSIGQEISIHHIDGYNVEDEIVQTITIMKNWGLDPSSMDIFTNMDDYLHVLSKYFANVTADSKIRHIKEIILELDLDNVTEGDRTNETPYLIYNKAIFTNGLPLVIRLEAQDTNGVAIIRAPKSYKFVSKTLKVHAESPLTHCQVLIVK
jgi:hypothetical protein